MALTDIPALIPFWYACLFLAIPAAWAFARSDFTVPDDRRAVQWGSAWVALIVAEFYIAGPRSFLTWSSDASFVGWFGHLNALEPWARLSTALAGGQDTALVNTGTQFIGLERLLLRVLPIWAAVAVHKAWIAALGMWGCWLLARKFGADRTMALAVSASFPLAHPYLGSFSTEFGTGFAALPLAVYVAVFRSRSLAWIAAATAVVALSEVMKTIPALGVAWLAVQILAGGRDVVRSAAVVGVFTVVGVLNWADMIHAILLGLPGSLRGVGAVAGEGWLGGHAGVSDFLLGVLLPTAMTAAGLLVLMLRRDKAAVRLAVALGAVVGSYLVLILVPWQQFGMDFINRMEHLYVRLAMPTVGPAALAIALATLSPRWSRLGTLAVLGLAVSSLAWAKVENLSNWFAFGGQQGMFNRAELYAPAWREPGPWRLVTVHDSPHSNLLATRYGFDTYDAQVMFPNQAHGLFWGAARNLPVGSSVNSRPGFDWSSWDGEVDHIGRRVRLDLLRLANVRWVLSSLPLSDPALRPVVESSPETWIRRPRDHFNSPVDYVMFRLKRMVVDPGRHFVYELTDPMPRAFAATAVRQLPLGTPAAQVLDAAAAAPGEAIVSDDLPDGSWRPDATMHVDEVRSVPDGYDVHLTAPAGGVMVLNTLPSRFWRFEDQAGNVLPATKVNGIHLAVDVPVGASKIRARYARPWLHEIIFGYLQ